MTDRAPRPEGMSERRLAELKMAVAPGATTYDGIDPNGRCLTCGQQPCECEIGMLRDALCEIERLRADGATLKVRADEALAAHSASFGALQTLSAALFDGEVDDYTALAEKVIARVRQLEADEATPRERVKLIQSVLDQPIRLSSDVEWVLSELRRILASAPKEPTP